MINTTKNEKPQGNATAWIAIVISLLALAVAGFAAVQSQRSAKAAVAAIRPILQPAFTDRIRVAPKLQIPLSITNVGKSSAAITGVRLVYWSVDQIGGGSEHRWLNLGNFSGGSVLRAGESRRFAFDVDRIQRVGSVSVDIVASGGDEHGLKFEFMYKGMEIDEDFTETLVLFPNWVE